MPRSLPKSNRQEFPRKNIWNAGGRNPTGKNRTFKRTGNNQMQFHNLQLVTPQSHLIRWTQTLTSLHFLLQKSQVFHVAGAGRSPKRNVDFVRLGVSLKRYQDSNRAFRIPVKTSPLQNFSTYAANLWHATSVIEAEAEREGAGRTDRSAGEYAGEVDHVEPVVEIANVALKAHRARFFFVEIEGGGEIDR